MTVKELITQLLECDLDSKGKRHIYEFSGIDHKPVWDSQECENIQFLTFKDWRYESEE